MKKFVSVLGSIGLVSISGASVVSCIAPQYAVGEQGQRIVIVTDGGQITDHSFDQGTYEGMLSYLDDAYNFGSSQKKVDGRRNYIVPIDTTNTSLVSAYRLSKLKKADALVLPGFVHMGPIEQTAKLFKDKTIIMIDGSPSEISKQGLYKDVISILFDSQIAGMQAGFDTAYWATQKDTNNKMYGDKNNDGKITIGTFGGVNGKFAVDGYMWGLFLGIALFNEYYQDSRAHVYLANARDHEVENIKLGSNVDPSYYSGNFQLGGATKSGIVNNLVNLNKADVVFPIAGSQIQDVLSLSGSNAPYVIGVDVDQAAVYNSANAQGRFITSAIKNIRQATEQALKNSASLKDLDANSNLVERDKSTTWNGTKPEPKLNWSIDLTGDGYKLKEHQLKLYDEQFSQESVDPNRDRLIYMVNEFYQNAGSQPTEYMDGQKIVAFAKKIIERSQDKTNGFDLVTNKENIGGK